MVCRLELCAKDGRKEREKGFRRVREIKERRGRVKEDQGRQKMVETVREGKGERRRLRKER